MKETPESLQPKVHPVARRFEKNCIKVSLQTMLAATAQND